MCNNYEEVHVFLSVGDASKIPSFDTVRSIGYFEYYISQNFNENEALQK